MRHDPNLLVARRKHKPKDKSPSPGDYKLPCAIEGTKGFTFSSPGYRNKTLKTDSSSPFSTAPSTAFGKKVDSREKNSPAFSFGTAKKSTIKPPKGDQPGPGAYVPPGSIDPTGGFTLKGRLNDTTDANDSPGPAAYGRYDDPNLHPSSAPASFGKAKRALQCASDAVQKANVTGKAAERKIRPRTAIGNQALSTNKNQPAYSFGKAGRPGSAKPKEEMGFVYSPKGGIGSSKGFSFGKGVKTIGMSESDLKEKKNSPAPGQYGRIAADSRYKNPPATKMGTQPKGKHPGTRMGMVSPSPLAYGYGYTSFVTDGSAGHSFGTAKRQGIGKIQQTDSPSPNHYNVRDQTATSDNRNVTTPVWRVTTHKSRKKPDPDPPGPGADLPDFKHKSSPAYSFGIKNTPPRKDTRMLTPNPDHYQKIEPGFRNRKAYSFGKAERPLSAPMKRSEGAAGPGMWNPNSTFGPGSPQSQLSSITCAPSWTMGSRIEED